MNKVHTHSDQPQMQAEVILASKHPEMENPLVTMRLRYPRIIHGEIMTHRVFSRNARSSRAVPVKTMLNEVREIPFIPWHWGKNQKGMQAGEECNEPVKIGDYFPHEALVTAGPSAAWAAASKKAAKYAEAFMEAGYHKQLANRLLEPFSWIDTLITANQWENFLWLRDHKDAEPHLQDLARLVKQALTEMEVQELKPGEWHLPYITEADKQESLIRFGNQYSNYKWLAKISAARCARISYKPFDGDASYERELERYEHLIGSDRVHASPTEHQAMPDWYDPDFPNTKTWEAPMLHGNLTGWIQFRKTIPGEFHE